MQAVEFRQSRLKKGRESIHSGQFMVSTFEAEEQDDEDELSVPIPEVPETNTVVPIEQFGDGHRAPGGGRDSQPQLGIDTSLAKLFQCMSLAYRQKLTSPKWNRFRGIKLRWKDKIRLNNVIWRCWHLQFIKKENTLVCQFASPLDVDTHNKPEAVVLEGKYWKRKLAAVTAEYKKWRMFYRNHVMGQPARDDVEMPNDVDLITWSTQSTENVHMMVDEDYMGLMSDTLFSTITNQPFVFPDSREIARAGLADFIQPSLGPLQPNLDDYMDTFEPLTEFIASKLPTVPEEQSQDSNIFKQVGWSYSDLDLMASNANLQNSQVEQYSQVQPIQQISMDKAVSEQNRQSAVFSNEIILPQQTISYVSPPPPPPPYHSTVISKNSSKNIKKLNQNRAFNNKPANNVYSGYQSMADPLQLPLQEQQPQKQQQFKLSDQSETPGYNFASSTVPFLKFTSPQVSHMMNSAHSFQYNTVHSHLISKEEKTEIRMRGGTRDRQRSRSNTREPIKRPPLISAVSDPALLTPSSSVLLTQLLTTSTENVFNRNQGLLTNREQIRIKEENLPITILPQPPPPPPPPAALIITPVTLNAVQSPPADPLLLNSFSNSDSPVLDGSQSLNSPTSSQSSVGSPIQEAPVRDQRRAGHIHAEQKRRYNIKTGFDMIHSLIPHLNQNPNAKLSKAAMLQKGAEYIRQLKSERNQLHEETDCLRQQIETLNTSISNCQSMLPATGAPVSRKRDNKMQEMFDEYVRVRTRENWKFWIFSLLFRPLLASFNNFVSTSSLDDLYRSTITWVEQHCTLVDLRPVVLNSLRYLSGKTDILAEPEKLPEEIRELVLTSDHKS